MCGIAGIYNIDSDRFNKNLLMKMSSALIHRGPDADGIFDDDVVGLAHRRLSIIDLSESANQPMTDSSKRYVIVYNGELYNFKDIAQDIKVGLNTDSDTEIVLQSYIKWGKDCVQRFNGMFAFAVYDRLEKNLFVSRDRMGIKPLYYFWNGNTFVFASELKAFQNKEFLLEYNKNAIADFLHLGYIPEPLTIYKNIFKLPAGNNLVLERGTLEIHPYWEIEDHIREETVTHFNSAKSILKDLLVDSVGKRMVADVPLGTFLSGGTDSSLVTAIAQSINNEAVKTFSIGFNDSKYNEAPYAAKIAEYLKTDHYEFILSEDDALNRINWMLNHYDEPFGDSSALPSELVSNKAKQHVTVCLSGDGGDELFHGYGSYRWAERLGNPLISKSREAIRFILSNLGNRYKRVSTLFDYRDQDFLPGHIFSQEQYLFSDKEIEMLILNGSSGLDYAPKLKRKLSQSEFQALFDLKYYLKDDLLVKVDRASMYNSLEVRVPLLDHRIVDFALDLNPGMKYKKGVSKYILKSVLYDYIPQKYFNRPKWGFSIPLQSWLTSQLKSSVDTCLNEEVIREAGFVNWEYVDKIKQRFYSGSLFLYNRIWLLYVLHKWLLNQKQVNIRMNDKLNYQHESKEKAYGMLDM